MEATELRIYNYVGCKVSNDAGTYQVMGIDGYKRIFKTADDERIYKKHIDDIKAKDKTPEWHDEMLIRISGGARYGEQYIESQIKGIILTEEWLLRFGFEKQTNEYYNKDSWVCFKIEKFMNVEWRGRFLISIQYVHQLQNLYFALTGEELIL